MVVVLSRRLYSAVLCCECFAPGGGGIVSALLGCEVEVVKDDFTKDIGASVVGAVESNEPPRFV